MPTNSKSCERSARATFSGALLMSVALIAAIAQADANFVAILAIALLAIFGQSARYPELPALLRPAVVLMMPTVLVSFVATRLPESSRGSALDLLLLTTIGSSTGLILGGIAVRAPVRRRANLAEARILFAAALLAAGYFFATSGIPILREGAEQARVDAAVSGTGYVRLLAYMSVPAAVALWGTGRRSWLFALGAGGIVLALGNRSPFLYLILSIAVVMVLSSANRRKSTRHFFFLCATLAALIVGIGTYRIVSQDAFADYEEYRLAMASQDYAAVAQTSLIHYAETVPTNAALVKTLVDSGVMSKKYGKTLATPIVSALPGEQLTLDREIKLASGKSFIGGGIPPTLSGEGYVNFGAPGSVIFGVIAGLLISIRAGPCAVPKRWEPEERRGQAALYGYTVAWVVAAQVAGFAGASTFPLFSFMIMLLLIGRIREN